MLSTANYEARKYSNSNSRFGVRSAMPGFIAKKLCPQLIIVPTRFDAYREASDQAKAIFKEYDPNVTMMSLDEAALDITVRLSWIMLRISYSGRILRPRLLPIKSRTKYSSN